MEPLEVTFDDNKEKPSKSLLTPSTNFFFPLKIKRLINTNFSTNNVVIAFKATSALALVLAFVTFGYFFKYNYMYFHGPNFTAEFTTALYQVTFMLGLTQFLFLKADIVLHSINDVYMFLVIMSVITFLVVTAIFAGLKIGIIFSWTTLSLIAIGFYNLAGLVLVVCSAQKNIRRIKIKKRNILLSTTVLPVLRVEETKPNNYLDEPVVEVVANEYFSILEYSRFLNIRFIYSTPVFVLALYSVLLNNLPLESYYNQYVLFQMPYFIVLLACVQLNQEIQKFESIFNLETKLSVRLFDQDLKDSWLFSLVVSVSSLVFKVAFNGQMTNQISLNSQPTR